MSRAPALNPASPGYLLYDVLHCQSMDWERVKRISVTKRFQAFKLIRAYVEWTEGNTRAYDFWLRQEP